MQAVHRGDSRRLWGQEAGHGSLPLSHTHTLASADTRWRVIGHGGPAPHTHTSACGSRKSTRRAGASHTHTSSRVAQVDTAGRARAPSLATSLVYGPMYMSYTRVDVYVLRRPGGRGARTDNGDVGRCTCLVRGGKPIHPRGLGRERWASLYFVSLLSLYFISLGLCIVLMYGSILEVLHNAIHRYSRPGGPHAQNSVGEIGEISPM